MKKNEIITLIKEVEAEYWSAFEEIEGHLDVDDSDYKQIKYGWLLLHALNDAIVNNDTANIENKLHHVQFIRQKIENELSA